MAAQEEKSVGDDIVKPSPYVLKSIPLLLSSAAPRLEILSAAVPRAWQRNPSPLLTSR